MQENYINTLCLKQYHVGPLICPGQNHTPLLQPDVKELHRHQNQRILSREITNN